MTTPISPGSRSQWFMRLQRRLRGRNFVPDKWWLEVFLDAGVWPDERFTVRGGRLAIPSLGISLSHEQAFFVAGFEDARLLQKNNAVFSNDQDGALVVTLSGITIQLQNATDLSTVQEVIGRHVYRVTHLKPFVVWDIGFNIGVSGLFYAQQPDVIAVYGYEPLPMAYEQALQNIRRNPAIGPKIQVFPYGVDATSRTVEIGYTQDKITGAGVYGLTVDGYMPQDNRVSFPLRSACEVFDEIRRQHPDTSLIVKMDCEGSEKDIIPALHDNDRLRDIDVLVAETHFADTQDIILRLKDAGMSVFDFVLGGTLGMIYAVRSHRH